MNRNVLLPLAGGVVGLASKHTPSLVSQFSSACKGALEQGLSDFQIQAACGSDFGNWDLLIIIGAGVAAVGVAFGREIVEGGKIALENLTGGDHRNK